MQPGYNTPPAKESGKLGLSPPTFARAQEQEQRQSRNNSPLPLFCQSSNVSISHEVGNNDEDEGRSLYQDFVQENLVSPENNVGNGKYCWMI
jgi:hypothetical protein